VTEPDTFFAGGKKRPKKRQTGNLIDAFFPVYAQKDG
jgi:hypothetical protein